MLALCAILALSSPSRFSADELSRARLHFRKVFEPDPKYKDEDVVSDMGEVYKVREFFPAGRADYRLIFGQSSETGRWIFARQSIKGKKSSTDWLVHLKGIPKRSRSGSGTLKIVMELHQVGLPDSAPKEARAAADAVTGYAAYRWDGWLGGVFTGFVLPNGTEARIEQTEMGLPGLRYVVTKAERRFLTRRRRK